MSLKVSRACGRRCQLLTIQDHVKEPRLEHPHPPARPPRPGQPAPQLRRALPQHTRVGWRCLVAAVLASACGNQEALGVSAVSVVSSGVINDPSNKSLRFDLLKFGLERFCVEMRRRGAPIKLSDHEPVLGRFFADDCHAQVLDQADRQSVVVRFAGKGYAWTNLTERLGFASTGLIEYAADFQRHEESMYIYFRPRSVGEATFRTALIESALAQVGLGLSGVDAEAIGKDIIGRQLQRGFTVIRHSARGEVEFSTGLVPVGQRPFRPFQVVNSDKLTLDNDRTELHTGQQDFIGGVHIDEDDKRLSLTLALDGASAVDVFVVPDIDGQTMLQAYVTQRGAARLPRAPLLDSELRGSAPSTLDLNLPKGSYFLLFDYSSVVGRSNPAPGQQAARVDYLVQVGDR
jgi:hypothetical protein